MPWSGTFVFTFQSKLPFWDSWLVKLHIIAIWAYMVEINKYETWHCWFPWSHILCQLIWNDLVTFRISCICMVVNLAFMGLFRQLASNIAPNGHYRPVWSRSFMWSCNCSLLGELYSMVDDINHSCHDWGHLCLHCSQIYHFETVG